MIATRKQREKEELRGRIIDAARELFVTDGYNNVSMRKIAERIEYSPTTIYLYFEDKAQLLREVCESAFAELGDEIVARQREGKNPIDVLRGGMLAYIDFGLTHPHHYDVIFISPKDRFIGKDDYQFENSMGQRAFQLMLDAVKACVESGDLKSTDVELTSQIFWAGIHGVTSLLITHDGFPFVDRRSLAESMVDNLISGARA